MSDKEWAELARAWRKEVKTAIHGPRGFATGVSARLSSGSAICCQRGARKPINVDGSTNSVSDSRCRGEY